MRTAFVISKSLALVFVFSLGYATITAQIRLAVYGGIHSASVIENNNIPGWDVSTKPDYSSQTGLHLGFLADIPVGHKGFYFQPALGYSTKGRQFDKIYNTNSGSDTLSFQTSLKLSYVEMPLYITYKLPLSADHKNNFFISAGPYLAFFYSGTMNVQSRIHQDGTDSGKFQYNNDNIDLLIGNAPDKYKTLDIGVNAKAGFEFGSIMLSGYYSRGLSSFYTATYSGTFHHQLLGVTLGIWLSKIQSPPAKEVKDTDKDGIPDNEDSCPLQPGTIAWKGCPVPDTDHDGIDDEHDSCKTVAGVARYNGCPVPDTDGDGIDDEHDACKTVAGVARYNGCPIPDTDGDGINDEEDKCPNEPGVAENQGCPVVKEEIVELPHYQARKVAFTSASHTLTVNSYASLNAMADTLLSHPKLHLTIEGHADGTGSPSLNLALSQQRANAVKTYLVKKGIPEARLTAIGYGQTRPIGNNKTGEGKAANRRVEFKLEVLK